MKKLMFIILAVVFLSGLCKAQYNDTLSPTKIQLNETNNRINHIQRNLAKCHKEYNTGITFIGIGVGIQVISVVMDKDFLKLDTNPNKAQMAISGLMELAGAIIVIHSHTWIGKASIDLSPNAIKYNF